MILPVKLHVFRIIQEFINNSIKYSNATILKLSLKKYKNYFLIIVHDNGKGFDFNTTKKGMGLKNIQYRIDLLKANHIMQSSPQKGTMLKILVKNEQ